MFSIGYGTVIFYCVSLTFYLFGVLYPNFFNTGMALGTLFFIVPSLIIGIMMKQRLNT